MIAILTRAGMAALALAALCMPPACAQSLLQRPVRILVGALPGTTADTQIRLLAAAMGESLSLAMIVDNRAGTDGTLAAQLAAKAAPNGHTLVVGTPVTHAIHPARDPKAYDPIRDFAAVSQLAQTGLVVTGAARLPARSIRELAASAPPGGATLRVLVPGLIEELASGALWARLGVRVEPVHPKDLRLLTLPLTSGEIELALLAPALARAHVHAGRLRAFGVTSAERVSILPEVATLQEQGVDGYEITLWDGLFAPAGTPREIVQALSQAAARALQSAAVRTRYDELGVAVVGNSPEAFAAAVQREVERYRKLVAEFGGARR